MLSDEEIRAEAGRRLSEMSAEEKSSIIDESKEDDALRTKASTVGYSMLSKEEKRRYLANATKLYNKTHPGGIEMGALEREIREKYKISREEIKHLEKNPFLPGMFKRLLLTAMPAAGTVAAAAITKNTGMEADAVYPVLSGLSGLLALSCGNELVKVFKFKKLKKRYETKEFQEQEIYAEMYRQLGEERERNRS